MRSLVIALLFCLQYQYMIQEVHGDSKLMTLLMRDVLNRYWTQTIPGNISLDIALSLIDLEFNPLSDVLTVTAWENYSWKDYRMAWYPDDFGRTESIRLPLKNVWTPDVMLYNGYGNNYRRAEVLVVVSSDGTFSWVQPSVFKVRCGRVSSEETSEEGGGQLEDEEEGVRVCTIKFGSWTYDGNMIRLRNAAETPDTSLYVPNRKLKLLDSSAKVNTRTYLGLNEPYLDYEMRLKIRHMT